MHLCYHLFQQTIICLSILEHELDHPAIYLVDNLLSASFVPGTMYHVCYNTKHDSCPLELKI